MASSLTSGDLDYNLQVLSPVTTARDSLQVKKQNLVRQEIWAAAVDLFQQHNFDEVTIDQIAESAGISRRTFFRYFSSKEDVMASVMKEYGAALVVAIEAMPAQLRGVEAAKAAIKDVVTPRLQSAERLADISRRSTAARMAQFLEVPLIEEQLSAAFARQSKRKTGTKMEDRVLAGLTLSVTGLAVESWLGNPRRALSEIVDEVFAAVAAACV